MQPLDVTEAAAATMERLPPPADRLPTLTEVVLLGGDVVHEEAQVAVDPSLQATSAQSVAADDTASDPAPTLDIGLSADALLASALPGGPALDAQALAQLVLADMAPRIDALFEARLREALAPALARAADVLIREARSELSLALRELVQDAVARTLWQGPVD